MQPTLLVLVLALAMVCSGEKVKIPGGTFVMGDGLSTKGPTNGALPQQRVKVSSFEMDSTTASNREFEEFVQKNGGYETDSEKFKWSFVLDLHCTREALEVNQGAVDSAKHWLAIPGASWKHPRGPNSFALEDHPAVHLSYNDAKAYCEYKGGRLPTETEWEHAARAGLAGKRYPWGDAPMQQAGDGRLKQWRANVWQGDFPRKDDGEDGYSGTCPVNKFAPNAFGMYNMVGNVWEWTSTEGPKDKGGVRRRVLRGASFVDSADGKFNHEANVNARMFNTEDSASSNTGVRCAYGKPPAVNSGYAYAAEKPQLDQETLGRIMEEGGIEALQKYLGKGATVMTGKDVLKKREELAKMKQQLERDEV